MPTASVNVGGSGVPSTTTETLGSAVLSTYRARKDARRDIADALAILGGKQVNPFEGALLPRLGKRVTAPAQGVDAPKANFRPDGRLAVTVPGPAGDPEKYAKGLKIGLVSTDAGGQVKSIVWATQRDGDQIIFPPLPKGSAYDSNGTLVFVKPWLFGYGQKVSHLPMSLAL